MQSQILQWCWSRTDWGWFYSQLSSQGWKKLFQGHRSLPSHLEYHKHTMLRGVEVVLQDLHVSFLLFQMPYKQSQHWFASYFLFFSPGRELPTRPASCGTKLLGEFCSFLFTLMGPCVFGGEIMILAVMCQPWLSLLVFFLLLHPWLAKSFTMVGSGSSFTQMHPCSPRFLFVPIELGLIFKDLQLDVASIACEMSCVPEASSVCTRKHLSVSKQGCSRVLLFTGRGVCVFLWHFGPGLHFSKVASNFCLFQFWIFLHEEYVNCDPG